VNDPLIEIPGGTFWMGAQKESSNQPHYDQAAWADEAPVHQVTLAPFYISKYPITVGQYQRFVAAKGYRLEKYWTHGRFQQFTAPEKLDEQLNYLTRPVVYVSWYEAFAYCLWFTEFKGDGHLYRLPTEAEWERAARRAAAAYRKYPWGSKEPDGETANFNQSQVGHASPVGIFPESCSPAGVIDLAGNVREWCWDWKDVFDQSSIFYQKSAGSTNPVNDESGAWGKVGERSYRVSRGGSWRSYARYCRSAYRDFNSRRNDDIGFRLVFVP
jgi:formylglycine-generating enzyme required for sulfatase activity